MTFCADRQRYFEGFPVGFYEDLHPNTSLNFEMNRFSTGEADMIEEMGFNNGRFNNLQMRQGILVGAIGFEPTTPCAQGNLTEAM